MGFVGSNREDSHDLGGEITIWLGDDKQVLTKSCLIFVPAGVKHGPIQFNMIKTPIFHVIITLSGKYSRKAAGNDKSKRMDAASQYAVITETKTKFSVAASGMPSSASPRPFLKSACILHWRTISPRLFMWISSGFMKGMRSACAGTRHDCRAYRYGGSDPEHPRDLGGAMSIVLGDETHVMTKSSLVCIPRFKALSLEIYWY
jgi:hypothetical protein